MCVSALDVCGVQGVDQILDQHLTIPEEIKLNMHPYCVIYYHRRNTCRVLILGIKSHIYCEWWLFNL
jgi:hypothetical protein